MRSILLTLSIILVSFLVFKGYSGGEDNNIEDHVWKEQTNTIKKAKEATQLIQDAAIKQRQEIENLIQQ